MFWMLKITRLIFDATTQKLYRENLQMFTYYSRQILESRKVETLVLEVLD